MSKTINMQKLEKKANNSLSIRSKNYIANKYIINKSGNFIYYTYFKQLQTITIDKNVLFRKTV